MYDPNYTHEGTVTKFHEFTCRDTGEFPRIVRLKETPRFWRDSSGVLYSKEGGWPRGRNTWRLKIDSVKRIDAQGKETK